FWHLSKGGDGLGLDDLRGDGLVLLQRMSHAPIDGCAWNKRRNGSYRPNACGDGAGFGKTEWKFGIGRACHKVSPISCSFRARRFHHDKRGNFPSLPPRRVAGDPPLDDQTTTRW